jgi:carbamoyl-phosphate synthase small subunit
MATTQLKTTPFAGANARASACLVLADGTVIEGIGLGAEGSAVGEICFNTAMTGYQEILTDPSYGGQIIAFTFPHIGNVGTNAEDLESEAPAARGLILKCGVSSPSNYRSLAPLDEWLAGRGIIGIAGIDTRALTRRVRQRGAPNAVIAHGHDGKFDIARLKREAREWPGLIGMDLAKEVTARQSSTWDEAPWAWGIGHGGRAKPNFLVVAIDYGIKRNILRSLVNIGAQVTVMPAQSSAESILARAPDGIFLSNGPGDPAATADYAVPVIDRLIAAGVPLFGICLGHQMLALALGAKTEKMHQGHHGANHPVKDLATSKVEIVSMNHGFTVARSSLPRGVVETHVSLFDGSNCGLAVEGKPVFSVQYHPEASPGPHDSHYLFARFAALILAKK